MARWILIQERANPGAGAAAAHLSLSAEDAEATAVLLGAAGVPLRIFFEPPHLSGGCAAFEQVSPETMKRRAAAERQERGGTLVSREAAEEARANVAFARARRIATAALVELQQPGLPLERREQLRRIVQDAEKIVAAALKAGGEGAGG